jgi:glycosyltransferase involved in cell wall biosynthesis
MPRPSFSVVIPLYNRELTIGEAIRSVISQTLPAAEIIVVDDASTDRSVRAASEFPVRVIQLDRNSGVSAARNAGIAAASGDVVAFLDSDDRWRPQHLETIADLLHRFPDASVAYTRMRSFGHSQRDWRMAIPENTSRDCYWDLADTMIVPMSAAAVRRNVLANLGGFDPNLRHSEDYELFLRLSRSVRFVCSHALLVEYRVHADQLTKSDGAIILSVWQTKVAERARLAQSQSDDVARFDQLNASNLVKDVWTLIHSGDATTIVHLHRLLKTYYPNETNPLLTSFYWALAKCRSAGRQMPGPVRFAGRKLAALLPH